jgi:hypothetical protein
MDVAITDPALLERQLLSDDDFLAHFYGIVANFPPREWDAEQFERGLRYPWYRPQRSYLLRDGEAALLHELDAPARAAALERHAGRVALLAFGGNAAPKYLSAKLAHHPEPEEREVLVLVGDLHDFDVVAVPGVAIYGAMPATLAASPGTAVRAAILMVTATQLTTLAWGEFPYRVGRLRGATFTVEDGVDGVEAGSPLAFVSRWGAFAPEGTPAALDAIPATGRNGRAWTQRELLDRAGEIILGEGNDAEALMRFVWSLGGRAAERGMPALQPYAQPFDFPGWAPVAPDGTFGQP